MIGLLDGLKVGAGVAIGGAVVFIYVQAVTLPAAREDARKLERAALDAATTKAIGELSNEADRARVNRRLCLERGGVWFNRDGECVERAAE